MSADKRAIRREFKERINPKGIFAVRCAASSEVWVSASRDLNASQTSTWFLLRNGLHHTKSLQTAWNHHEGVGFSFEVLEQFEDDLAPTLLSDRLRDRQKHWLNELGATALQVG